MFARESADVSQVAEVTATEPLAAVRSSTHPGPVIARESLATQTATQATVVGEAKQTRATLPSHLTADHRRRPGSIHMSAYRSARPSLMLGIGY